jgi:pyrroline-5-carboxylate reductase
LLFEKVDQLSDTTIILKGRRIGVIGGGKMGEGIVAGLLRTGLVGKEDLLVCDIVPERRGHLSETYGIKCTGDDAEVVRRSDVIILSVRPSEMANTLVSIREALSREKLLISIAAGVTTGFIRRGLGQVGVDLVRAMPNNPCTIGEGMTALTAPEETPVQRLEEAERIFSSVGRTVRLEEYLFDAVTGLSGSGPAYVYLFIEALADGGVKMGIPKNIAVALAAQTVLGSAKMVLETGEHPAKLKDLVATPAGTTVAGLYELEEAGMRAACMGAVEAATKRAGEISAR